MRLRFEKYFSHHRNIHSLDILVHDMKNLLYYNTGYIVFPSLPELIHHLTCIRHTRQANRQTFFTTIKHMINLICFFGRSTGKWIRFSNIKANLVQFLYHNCMIQPLFKGISFRPNKITTCFRAPRNETVASDENKFLTSLSAYNQLRLL